MLARCFDAGQRFVDVVKWQFAGPCESFPKALYSGYQVARSSVEMSRSPDDESLDSAFLGHRTEFSDGGMVVFTRHSAHREEPQLCHAR